MKIRLGCFVQFWAMQDRPTNSVFIVIRLQILKGLEMESRMHIRFLDVDTTTMRCGKSSSTSWRTKFFCCHSFFFLIKQEILPSSDVDRTKKMFSICKFNNCRCKLSFSHFEKKFNTVFCMFFFLSLLKEYCRFCHMGNEKVFFPIIFYL